MIKQMAAERRTATTLLPAVQYLGIGILTRLRDKTAARPNRDTRLDQARAAISRLVVTGAATSAVEKE